MNIEHTVLKYRLCKSINQIIYNTVYNIYSGENLLVIKKSGNIKYHFNSSRCFIPTKHFFIDELYSWCSNVFIFSIILSSN